MHVFPLPFGLGLAFALLPQREVRLLRDDKRAIRVTRGPNHRERVLAATDIAIYRRPIA